jgi:hypothetical protein
MKALLAIATVAIATATAASAWSGTLVPGSRQSLPNERHHGVTFITDTLAPGGDHSSPYDAPTHGVTFITDTLAPGGGGGGGGGLQSAAAPTGFSWPDAGVGAAGAAGGMLALVGIGLIAARRRTGLAV